MHAYYFIKKNEAGLEEIIRSKRQEIRPTIQLIRNYFRSKKAFFSALASWLLRLDTCY